MISQKLVIPSLVAVSLLLAGCGCMSRKQAEAAATKAEHAVVDAVENAAEKVKTVVINVLDKAYYEDGHIEGSLNIPFEELDQKLPELEAQKDSTLFVMYCANPACTASLEAAKKMQELGFNVVAYEGGSAEWYQKAQVDPEHYKFSGPAQQEYLKEPATIVAQHDGSVKLISAEELSARLAPAPEVSVAAPAAETAQETQATPAAEAAQ